MQPDISQLFHGPLDVQAWTFFKHKDDVAYGGVSIPGLSQDIYRKDSPEGTLSVGVFTFEGTLAYIAWGYKDEPHCRYHAHISGGTIGTSVAGCPAIAPQHSTDGVRGFTLDTQHAFQSSTAPVLAVTPQTSVDK